MTSGVYMRHGPNWGLKAGATFRVLGDNDVLRSTDWCRSIVQDGPSGGGWDTTFKPHGWDGTSWHLVGNELFAWVGLTMKDYKLFRFKVNDYFTNNVNIIETILAYNQIMSRHSYEIIRVGKCDKIQPTNK